MKVVWSLLGLSSVFCVCVFHVVPFQRQPGNAPKKAHMLRFIAKLSPHHVLPLMLSCASFICVCIFFWARDLKGVQKGNPPFFGHFRRSPCSLHPSRQSRGSPDRQPQALAELGAFDAGLKRRAPPQKHSAQNTTSRSLGELMAAPLVFFQEETRLKSEVKMRGPRQKSVCFHRGSAPLAQPFFFLGVLVSGPLWYPLVSVSNLWIRISRLEQRFLNLPCLGRSRRPWRRRVGSVSSKRSSSRNCFH